MAIKDSLVAKDTLVAKVNKVTWEHKAQTVFKDTLGAREQLVFKDISVAKA